jgi:hypothetical protein
VVAGARIDRRDDALDDDRVVQEVLAESPPRAVPFDRRPLARR